MLRLERAVSLVIVTTLALGIGANAAIVGLVDAMLWRPLPYPTSDRIVCISGPRPQSFVRFVSSEFQLWPSEIERGSVFAGLVSMRRVD
jgi:hypothetical protein